LGRKFLGYELWIAQKGEVKRAVSRKALATVRQRIRQVTRRSGGRSISEVIEKLRPYVVGWKAYYGLAQTSRVLRGRDEWMRHRLRAIHLKHWRRESTIYRELLRLGAKPKVALLVAKNSRRWWRNRRFALNNVLTIAYFDRLGMPRLT
jgi:RNA-directed DNA polymerase